MAALWLSLRILGAAGFVAFLVGMGTAQLVFRVRPSVNAAFVGGLVAYALTLIVWSIAIGPPQPSKATHTPTPTTQTT
ncbi:MAG TPA: hypothetical protein PK691_11120 [Thermomicrobiales bacterium]|nr:hypothetical protein [Thermomicrobiales bacterium]